MADPPALLRMNLDVRNEMFKYFEPRDFIATTFTCWGLFNIATSKDGSNVVLYHLSWLPGEKKSVGQDCKAGLYCKIFYELSTRVFRWHMRGDCHEFSLTNIDIGDSILYAYLCDTWKFGTGSSAFVVDKGTGTIFKITNKIYGTKVVSRTDGKIDGKEWHKVLALAATHHYLFVLQEQDHSQGRVVHPNFNDYDQNSKCTRSWCIQVYDRKSMQQLEGLERELTGPPRQKVPVYLTAEETGHIAILWDIPGSTTAETAEIELQYFDKDFYSRPRWSSMRGLNPVGGTPHRPVFGPKAIACAEHGATIKLFGMDEIVPYEIVQRSMMANIGSAQLQTTLHHNLHMMRVGPAFSSMRWTTDTSSNMSSPDFHSIDLTKSSCWRSHLSVAIIGPSFNFDIKQTGVLCIMRSIYNKHHDRCQLSCHTLEECNDQLPDVTEDRYKIAAKLAGWKETKLNLTGNDSITINRTKSRIAAIMPDEILVWCLDVQILHKMVNASLSENTDRTKSRNLGIEAVPFWKKEEDNELGYELPVLQPIRLNLKGARAKKLMWVESLIPCVGAYFNSANAPDRSSRVANPCYLLVMTDRSIQIWFLDSESTGKWQTKEMNFEI